MKFKTRKKANLLVLLVIIFFTIISTAGIIFSSFKFTVKADKSWLPILAFSILFLIISFILYLQSYAWYTSYEIIDGKLKIRGVYKKGIINLEDIAEVKSVSEKEADSIIKIPLEKAAECVSRGDIKGWYNNNKNYSEITNFSTVQIVQSYSGSETPNVQEYQGSIIGSRLVSLRLTNGKIFLLSPDDPEYFVKTFDTE